MCLEWFPAHSAMFEISMYKCSITLSRDTNDSRRSVLVRIGMRRAYATKTTTFLMCCNGCSLAIGDRNTIRTAVVFRLGLLASALSSDGEKGKGRGDIVSYQRCIFHYESSACIHVRSHLHPGRQDVRICARRGVIGETNRRWRPEYVGSDVCESESRMLIKIIINYFSTQDQLSTWFS